MTNDDARDRIGHLLDERFRQFQDQQLASMVACGVDPDDAADLLKRQREAFAASRPADVARLADALIAADREPW